MNLNAHEVVQTQMFFHIWTYEVYTVYVEDV